MKIQALIATMLLFTAACSSGAAAPPEAGEEDLSSMHCTLVFATGDPRPRPTACPGTLRCAEDPRTTSCTSAEGQTRCPGECVDVASAQACDPVSPACAAGFSCVDDPRAFDVSPIPDGVGICVKGTPPPPTHTPPGGACDPLSITGRSTCGLGMKCVRVAGPGSAGHCVRP